MGTPFTFSTVPIGDAEGVDPATPGASSPPAASPPADTGVGSFDVAPDAGLQLEYAGPVPPEPEGPVADVGAERTLRLGPVGGFFVGGIAGAIAAVLGVSVIMSLEKGPTTVALSRLLFPWAAMAIGANGPVSRGAPSQTLTLLVLGLAQFPLYGMFCGVASGCGKLGLAFWTLLVLHVAAIFAYGAVS